MCAVAVLSLLASTPWPALAAFRGTVQSNQQVTLRFVVVAGPPGVGAAVTIFELDDERVRDVKNVSLEPGQEQQVQILPSRNTRRIIFEVDPGLGTYVRVRVDQNSSAVIPDELVNEDTRYVFNVR